MCAYERVCVPVFVCACISLPNPYVLQSELRSLVVFSVGT